jgi:hypothetical protein
LIVEAHNRLKEEGIRYSFLGTGKSLVSYDLYRKLGYHDFTLFKRGFMRCGDKRSNGITLKTNGNQGVIMDIFQKYSEGLLGFVKRPANFLEVRKAWSWFHYDLVCIFYEDVKPIGYAIASKEDKILKLWELCCPNKKDLIGCISELGSKLEAEHIVLELVDRFADEEQFAKIGFKVFDESYGILMVKDLKENESAKRIQRIYGLDQKRFHMTAMDEY